MDLIDRNEAIEAVDGNLGDWNAENWAVSILARLPSADISETMICGYPARHLAFIATVMQKEGVSPKEVASCLRDVGRMVAMIVAEQKEIVEKALGVKDE